MFALLFLFCGVCLFVCLSHSNAAAVEDTNLLSWSKFDTTITTLFSYRAIARYNLSLQNVCFLEKDEVMKYRAHSEKMNYRFINCRDIVFIQFTDI